MEGGANSESMRMSLLNDEPFSEHDEPDYHSMQSFCQSGNTSYLPGRSTSRPAPRQTLTTTGRDYVEARQTMTGTGCVFHLCEWLAVLAAYVRIIEQ